MIEEILAGFLVDVARSRNVIEINVAAGIALENLRERRAVDAA